MEPKLISFHVFHVKGPDGEDDGVVASTLIKGYPSSEECPGKSVCRTFITRYADIQTVWFLPGYQDDPQVGALLAKDCLPWLKAAWNERNRAKDGPRIYVVVRDGALTDVRLPQGLGLDVQVLEIDSGSPDYDKLYKMESALYEDGRYYSADFGYVEDAESEVNP